MKPARPVFSVSPSDDKNRSHDILLPRWALKPPSLWDTSSPFLTTNEFQRPWMNGWEHKMPFHGTCWRTGYSAWAQTKSVAFKIEMFPSVFSCCPWLPRSVKQAVSSFFWPLWKRMVEMRRQRKKSRENWKNWLDCLLWVSSAKESVETQWCYLLNVFCSSSLRP